MNETTHFPNRLTTSFVKRFCPDPCAMHDLVALYDEFNFTFFNGALKPLSTYCVEKDGEVYTYAHDLKWTGRFKTCRGKYYYADKSIKIGKWQAHSPYQVRSTLLHEMVHKYLDMVGLDDGVEGHGENFITEAVRVNKMCEELDVNYRVNFYDEVISREDPVFSAELIGREVMVIKDLDLIRKLRGNLNAAFDRKWTFHQ